MKALIFAAGLGTRLRPFTCDHPKALVPVNGIPQLQRVIEKLQFQGIDSFVINVHHFADQIIDFLSKHNNFGSEIKISDERDHLLDTGGGLLNAKDLLINEEDFIIYNVDILTDISLLPMIDYHRNNDALATLLIEERDTQRYLLFDKDRMMKGWTNIKTNEVRPQNCIIDCLKKTAFGGIHVVSSKIFPLLQRYKSQGSVFSIMDFYIEICTNSKIMGYHQPENSLWFDIGKPESLKTAESYF